MAIQIPNPGTGNGATGDNEFVLWSKVKDNFSDQTNAASKVVGTANGQIPLAQDTLFAANNTTPTWRHATAGFDADSAENGQIYFVQVTGGSTNINFPPPRGKYTLVTKRAGYQGNEKLQIATGEGIWFRISENGVYSPWKPATHNFYNTTTASGANTVIDSTGNLMRSTSSERYKDILAPLELDDAKYADAMALKPIVYRSIADADNPTYHYYSFSAEELGTYDPAFTLWRDTETVTDEDGNVTEQPLAERQAEGININALLAMGHAIAIKQGELIKKLEARIEALEEK